MSLLGEIETFSKSRLKRVETVVKTVDGRELIERKGEQGEIDVHLTVNKGLGFVGDLKPDLKVARILPFLALGSQDVAHEFAILRDACVTRILNVASGVPNSFEEHFTYKHLDLLDLPDTNIRSVFEDCFQFINEARDEGGVVLVHCNAGVSRSAAIVIGYLIKFRAMSFIEAFEFVRKERPAVRPNDGFVSQLKQFDVEVLGIRTTFRLQNDFVECWNSLECVFKMCSYAKDRSGRIWRLSDFILQSKGDQTSSVRRYLIKFLEDSAGMHHFCN